jgi:hypothetical protein
MRGIIKKIKAINPFDLRDLHIYGGLLLMAAGLWMVSPWLALAVPGALLFLSGIFSRKLA